MYCILGLSLVCHDIEELPQKMKERVKYIFDFRTSYAGIEDALFVFGAMGAIPITLVITIVLMANDVFPFAELTMKWWPDILVPLYMFSSVALFMFLIRLFLQATIPSLNVKKIKEKERMAVEADPEAAKTLKQIINRYK